MAFTVTATAGGSFLNGILLRVKVLTGAADAASQTTTGQIAAAAYQKAITTTVPGSIVYGALTDDASFTANGSTTLFDNTPGSAGTQLGSCRATSATGSTPGSVTIGATATGPDGGVALFEILPDGTITEDPSAPGPASSTTLTTATSASFNPPAGSLLVVMASALSASMAITDTSGLGLTWIQKIAMTTDGYAGVWIAQMPSAPAAPNPRPAPGWHPGTGLPGLPGGTPFYTPPVSALLAPFTVIQAAPTVEIGSLTGPVTATFGSPTGGQGPSTLVACISTQGSSVNPLVSTVTLGGSADHWAKVIADNPLVSFGGEIWYDPGCAAGQTSVAVTCTGGAGAPPSLFLTVYEVAGILAADKSASNVATGATTWTSGTTGTTTTAPEIAFGVVMADGSQAPPVTGAGTWITQSLLAGTWGQRAGYQFLAATGTAAFSGTMTSGQYAALVATFSAAAGIATGTATLAGAGAVTAVATQAATANLAGTGQVTATATQASPATAAGAGAVAAVATQIAGASLAGAGSAAATAAQAAGAALTGAGSVTAVATQAAKAALTGAGTLAAAATQAAGASAAGAGTVTAVATQIAGATLAGAGVVTAAGTVSGLSSGTAAIAGAGAVTALATQAAVAAPAGTGTVTAAATQAAPAALTGAGTVTAKATQAAGSTLTGAGTLAAVATQAATASPAGAGSLTAAGSVTGGTVTGTATLAGAGVLTAKAAQAAAAALAGSGVLAGSVAQRAGAVLAGAGTLTALGGVPALFTVGSLTASGTPASTLTAAGASSALTASTAPSGTLTAGTQSTGGPQ